MFRTNCRTPTDLFVNPATTADDFAEQLDAVVVEMLDRHCPLHERKRFMSARRENRWLSAAAVDFKRQRRRLERQWKATGRDDHYVAYRKSCRVTNKIIVESRGAFYNDRIEAASADPRRRWAAIRNVLHLTESRQVRSSDDSARLSTGFAQFFVEKIRSIKAALKERLGATYNDPLEFDVRHEASMLTDVKPPTVDEVLRAIRSMPAKSSPLDSIPTSVIKTCAETFAVLVTRLITLSFAEGKIHTTSEKRRSGQRLIQQLPTDLQSSDHLQDCGASVYVAAGRPRETVAKLQPVPISVQAWPLHGNSSTSTPQRCLLFGRQRVSNNAAPTRLVCCIRYDRHEYIASPSTSHVWCMRTSTQLDRIVPGRQKTVSSCRSTAVAERRLRVRCPKRFCTRPTAVCSVHVTSRSCYRFFRDRSRSIRRRHTTLRRTQRC